MKGKLTFLALSVCALIAHAAGGAVFVENPTSSARVSTTATAIVSGGAGFSVSHADMSGTSGAKLNEASYTIGNDGSARASASLEGGSYFSGQAYNYSTGSGTGSATASQASTYYVAAEVLTCACSGVSASGLIQSGNFSYMDGIKTPGSTMNLFAGSNEGIGGYIKTDAAVSGFSWRGPTVAGTVAPVEHSTTVRSVTTSTAETYRLSNPDGRLFNPGTGSGNGTVTGNLFFPSLP